MATTQIDVKATLVAAKALLPTPDRWVKKALEVNTPTGKAMCIRGAVLAAAAGGDEVPGPEYEDATSLKRYYSAPWEVQEAAVPVERALLKAGQELFPRDFRYATGCELATFNNKEETTFEDIHRLIDRAVELAA